MLFSFMFFPLEVSNPEGTNIFGHQFNECGIHGSVIQEVEIMVHNVVGRFKKIVVYWKIKWLEGFSPT